MQDKKLKELVAQMGVSRTQTLSFSRVFSCGQPKNWKKIAEQFSDRTDVQCLHRWQKVLNPEMVKGPWTEEEDRILMDAVSKQGAQNWSQIAQHLVGRIGKQCRER